MNLEFREKAKIAYETLPEGVKVKTNKIIANMQADPKGFGLHSAQKLNLAGKVVFVIKIDLQYRLLFSHEGKLILILDIIRKGGYAI